jgi:hypothetical protein
LGSRGGAGAHRRAAVRQPRHQAQQHRHLQAFRQLEGLAREVVALLLVGRFQAGHHRKVGEVARVLLVLRTVHRRVVGHHHHQPAMRARHATFMNGSAATFRPTCFIDTMARLPA